MRQTEVDRLCEVRHLKGSASASCPWNVVDASLFAISHA
jgi:hypothetical protein